VDEAPSDREQIGDLLVRYATGIDTKDWPLFRTCFTDDVRADYGDIGVWTDVDAITEFMRVTHETMPATKHLLSNVAIEVDGDVASARSYVHAVLVVTEEPAVWVDAIGQYDDELVRTADGWRIRARRFSLTRQLVSGGAAARHA
jgi:3-phenylpropionate/cinnamic acid dioxygenase small subunit